MKLCDLYSKLPFLTVSSVFVFGFSFKGASKQKIPFAFLNSTTDLYMLQYLNSFVYALT